MLATYDSSLFFIAKICVASVALEWIDTQSIDRHYSLWYWKKITFLLMNHCYYLSLLQENHNWMIRIHPNSEISISHSHYENVQMTLIQMGILITVSMVDDFSAVKFPIRSTHLQNLNFPCFLFPKYAHTRWNCKELALNLSPLFNEIFRKKIPYCWGFINIIDVWWCTCHFFNSGFRERFQKNSLRSCYNTIPNIVAAKW